MGEEMIISKWPVYSIVTTDKATANPSSVNLLATENHNSVCVVVKQLRTERGGGDRIVKPPKAKETESVSSPACACLLARKGLVIQVIFLGLISKTSITTNEIVEIDILIMYV